jgi:hypothetical protein
MKPREILRLRAQDDKSLLVALELASRWTDRPSSASGWVCQEPQDGFQAPRWLEHFMIV